MTTKPGSKETLIWLMLVMGAMLAAGYYLWTQDTRRGRQSALYSVERTDDRGAALVYRLYQQAGLQPRVWDRDLTALKEPGLLILLEPAREKRILGGVPFGSVGDLLPHEIQALDRWVRQGNVVVVLARDYNPLYDALGLIVDEPKSLSGIPAEPTQPSLLARRVKNIQTHTQFGFKYGRKKDQMAEALKVEPQPPPVPAIPAGEWIELFVKKEGQRSVPQVVSAARGRGLYVAVNDVFPAGNLGLTMADNARFMLNVARLAPPGGSIWFDEFHKREVERTMVGYLRERALIPAFLYALLLAALVFWRTGARFGAPQPLIADRRRDSGEYVRAVAALYQNAGMTRDALSTIYADFRRRLTGALRMDGLTNLDEVGRRYEARTGRPAIEARQILIETEAALAREKLDLSETLQFCARLTHLDQALQRARPGANQRDSRHAQHRGTE